jgi:hypothetical protein
MRHAQRGSIDSAPNNCLWGRKQTWTMPPVVRLAEHQDATSASQTSHLSVSRCRKNSTAKKRVSAPRSPPRVPLSQSHPGRRGPQPHTGRCRTGCPIRRWQAGTPSGRTRRDSAREALGQSGGIRLACRNRLGLRPGCAQAGQSCRDRRRASLPAKHLGRLSGGVVLAAHRVQHQMREEAIFRQLTRRSQARGRSQQGDARAPRKPHDPDAGTVDASLRAEPSPRCKEGQAAKRRGGRPSSRGCGVLDNAILIESAPALRGSYSCSTGRIETSRA